MSTYKNSDGRWMVDVKVRLPEQRRAVRVRRVSPAGTKRGAEKYEREVRAAILNGTWGEDAPAPEPAPTLEQWVEIFVVQHSEAKRLQPGTIREQRAAFRLYLLPILGAATRIDEIRTPHFDRVRRGMAARRLSPKTTNNVLGVLSCAVRFHFGQQGVDVPNFDACRLKLPVSAPKFWTPDQYAALHGAATHLGAHHLAVLLLMGDCGLRTGEVIALEWSHLVWRPKPQIVVQRAHNNGHWGPPKHGRTRTVPMTERAAAAVKAIPPRIGVPWVLTREGLDGPTHATRRVLAWMVVLAEREIGVARSRSDGQLHKLRHTYITRLGAAGVPPRAIMALAGHRHLSTTMRYMHLIPGATSDGVAALERFDQQSTGAELGQDRGRDHG